MSGYGRSALNTLLPGAPHTSMTGEIIQGAERRQGPRAGKVETGIFDARVE